MSVWPESFALHITFSPLHPTYLNVSFSCVTELFARLVIVLVTSTRTSWLIWKMIVKLNFELWSLTNYFYVVTPAQKVVTFQSSLLVLIGKKFYVIIMNVAMMMTVIAIWTKIWFILIKMLGVDIYQVKMKKTLEKFIYITAKCRG